MIIKVLKKAAILLSTSESIKKEIEIAEFPPIGAAILLSTSESYRVLPLGSNTL